MLPKVLLLLAIITTSFSTDLIEDENISEPEASSQESTTSSSSSRSFSINIPTSMNDTVLLHDGHSIPQIGLGVALTGSKTFDAVQYALNQGYRLIDTASHESYGNEKQVGKAIRDCIFKSPFSLSSSSKNSNNSSSTPPVSRKDVFVITKLWDDNHGFYKTLKAFDKSYDTLDIGPIDLYMIHSPYRGKLIETYDALLYYQQMGWVKSIGVSNFGIPHLQAIKDAGRPLPVVNQIEMHPLVYKYRLPLLEWCQHHQIKIQAYGSLMHGYEEWLSESTILKDMQQQRYPTKTTAQILLRWAIQHGFLIIPKSSRRQRIKENSKIFDFELTKEDMLLLDNWGDHVTDEQRNIYEEDWGWNPIDDLASESEVKLGKTNYWPEFEGVKWTDEIYNENEHDEFKNVYSFREEL